MFGDSPTVACLPDFDCVVWLEGASIFEMQKDDFDNFGIDDNFVVEVTAPTQEFINQINFIFDCNFDLSGFPGR